MRHGLWYWLCRLMEERQPFFYRDPERGAWVPGDDRPFMSSSATFWWLEVVPWLKRVGLVEAEEGGYWREARWRWRALFHPKLSRKHT